MHFKRYFKPFDEQELEHMSGDFSLCGSRRHRYADVLQWADDTSALLGVDDPALSDRLKRRQSRAVSALQRTLATSRQGPGAQGTKAVRPNSAPPGFDPVPVGSALQAALVGALESVQAQVSSQTSSLSFESRLLDEYLRSQSLQPNQPGSGKATAGPHGTAEAAAATAVHTGQATCVGAGVAAAAPVRPLSSGMRQQQSADFTDLPLIDEGVEEVEEGMDGEDLAQKARLMYYGSRRPRRSSAARTRSTSPGNRSLSPAASRPFGASQHNSRPANTAAPPAGSQQQQQQQQQQQHQFALQRPHSARLPPRPLSAYAQTSREGHGSLSMASPPAAAGSAWATRANTRPWSASSAQARPAAAYHAGHAAPAAAHGDTTPLRNSWTSSTGATRHASVVVAGSGVLATTGQVPGHASHTKLRDRGDFTLRASSLSLERSGSALSSPRGARDARAAGPSNGIVVCNPCGPSIATKRAQRPQSARAAAEKDRQLQQACAASTARWSKPKRPASATAPSVAVVSFPNQSTDLPCPDASDVPGITGCAANLMAVAAAPALGASTTSTANAIVGRHREVKAMMALQAARHASIVRLSALQGLAPVA